MIGIGIGINRLRGGAFSPATLFSAGEPGFWFDHSDLSTLFQDAAGTMPVTTPGQTVAFKLDKSQGLVLGPNEVTNGGFDSDTAWTKGTGWTISGGVATKAPGTGASLSQSIGAVEGRFYRVDITVTRNAGFGFVRVGSLSDNRAPISTAGTYTYSFIIPRGSDSALVYVFGDASFDATIDNISVRLLPGNHAVQSTALQRPTWQVDEFGRGYLQTDGVDDSMVTPVITPGTDKVQVFAGVRKLSDAETGVIMELSSSVSANNGALRLTGPANAGIADYRIQSKGTTQGIATSTASYPAPITNVITALGDISGDRATLRVDGVTVEENTGDQGTGNFLAYPVYLYRRGGSSLPFNGRSYQEVVRFGPNLTDAQIAAMETFIAGKTGVSL